MARRASSRISRLPALDSIRNGSRHFHSSHAGRYDTGRSQARSSDLVSRGSCHVPAIRRGVRRAPLWSLYSRSRCSPLLPRSSRLKRAHCDSRSGSAVPRTQAMVPRTSQRRPSRAGYWSFWRSPVAASRGCRSVKPARTLRPFWAATSTSSRPVPSHCSTINPRSFPLVTWASFDPEPTRFRPFCISTAI